MGRDAVFSDFSGLFFLVRIVLVWMADDSTFPYGESLYGSSFKKDIRNLLLFGRTGFTISV